MAEHIVNSVIEVSQVQPADLIICDHKLLRVAQIEALGGRCRLTFEGTDAAVEIYSGETLTRVTLPASRP